MLPEDGDPPGDNETGRGDGMEIRGGGGVGFGRSGFFFLPFLFRGLGHGKAFGRCVEARATIFCGAPVAKRFYVLGWIDGLEAAAAPVPLVRSVGGGGSGGR